jgi:hypothetical protein
MFKSCFTLALFFASALSAPALHAASLADPPDPPPTWRAKVAESIPLLGHRNWILVVDSAYPLQSSPGIETIETGDGMTEVLRYVLGVINRSEHVRPDIFLDAELPFVPEDDAPGVGRYRAEINDLLRPYQVQSLPHEKLISSIDEASKTFHILVLKTHLTIPYSSVFVRLNCRYWSDDAEARLRAKIASAPPR